MKTINPKHVEKALYHLSMDNPKRAKLWLLKALNLVVAVPERKMSYTWKDK